MKPTQPSFIPMPFAYNGNKNTIPSKDAGDGSASWSAGFPALTETPVKNGGVPPTRKDFNGILNALSAFVFFGQSGGIYTYSKSLDYIVPSVVYYNGLLYWCVKANGVSSTVATPGSDSDYWIPYIQFLLNNAESVGLKLGGSIAVGTIIIWASSKAVPSDYGTWLECNGQSCAGYPDLVSVLGSNYVPNYNAMFLRGAGAQTISSKVYTAAGLGSYQTDAIRNITGQYLVDDQYSENSTVKSYTSGAFYLGDRVATFDWSSSAEHNGYLMKFDASRVVPTAGENRPVNKTVRYMIKAAD